MPGCTLVLLVFLAGGAEPYEVCPESHKIRFGGKAENSESIAVDEFDHTTLDFLLRKFVGDHGLVSYREWKADDDSLSLLDAYLKSLGRADPHANEGSIAGRLAYYINAYNALAIRGILLEYPTPSIQQHNRRGAAYRIFDDLEVWIGDGYVSLNMIENEELRPLGDPRIHFALVCAARGCPKLRNEAYTPGAVDHQLEDNSRDFFARATRFHVKRLTKKVYLSPILKWYREDFGATDCEILAKILPFVCPDDQEWLVQNLAKARIKYMGYDWGLNDRCPSARIKIGRTPYSFYAKVQPCVDSVRARFTRPAKSPGDCACLDAEPAAVSPAPAETPSPPRALNPIRFRQSLDRGRILDDVASPALPKALTPLPNAPRALDPLPAPRALHPAPQRPRPLDPKAVDSEP